MQSNPRALLVGVCALQLLAGCNFDNASNSSSSTSSLSAAASAPGSTGSSGASQIGYTTGSTATTPTDAVTATASVLGTVSVVAGSSETITVAFTSADGRPISGLALSNTSLPADWSGPTDFTCTVTGSGNDCVLSLTYAPTAAETGTLALGYVYAGDPTAPALITLNIPYAATAAANNIVATPAPIGQINAAVGTGSQSVSVNFTTDDGHAATGLTLTTALSSLPAGWSTTTPGFSCAIVSNGSGCQIVLNYAPTVAASGTLTLNYSYMDDSGTTRTGGVNLPYSSTVNGNVDATVSPAGQVNAVQKSGTQGVTITFTTDDGQAAHNLMMLSPQSSLPAGWSGSLGGFTCGTVSTGNGCQLKLTYAPTALTGGTVELDYGYTNPAGTFTTGSVNIPYAATTSDNIVATPTPSGQIAAIVGEVDPSVVVAFTTDDSRTVTNLQLTTTPATLPPGWASTDSSFACAGVGAGATCQLPLTYTPTAAASGTLTLGYSYLDNAGQAKTGSLNIPYRSNTDDTIVGTQAPLSIDVVAGTSTAVSLTFASDDGNPASTLAVTSGLTSLPAGWSTASSTFTCTTVSAGTVCQLPLTYAPTGYANSSLPLTYTYVNNAGKAKTGTLSIPYKATTNDTVVGTPSVSSINVTTGTSTAVTVTFATSDGNPANSLAITSGLSPLAAGWSSTDSSFACSTVSASSTCQLALTYDPTSQGSGTLLLPFTYANDSGTVTNGLVSISYSATPP